MRAVARLFALGRDGLPDGCSPPTSASACAGLAFLPWGLPPPWAGAWPFCFLSFSSAISYFTFLTVSGLLYSPVREELNLVASGQWLVARKLSRAVYHLKSLA